MSESTIAIPNDVIQPIIQAKVTAAIVESLGGYDRLVEKAIVTVLNMKVDNSGNPDRYDSSRGPTWLAWVMEDCVKRAAKTAVEEFFKEHQDVIKKQLTTELSKKNSPLAKQLVNSFIGSVVAHDSMRYRLHVSVESA